MVPRLHSWLFQKDRSMTAEYKVKVRAHLNQYVLGEEIDNCEYMKHLCDGIWEFRVQFPSKVGTRKSEATRIFGAFVYPDKFVATHQALRRNLGNKRDRRWRRAINRSLRDIAALSLEPPPGLLPMIAVPFTDCVTFAALDWC